ncbi:succinylglutamate desuccinylase/aspartoacylase family protein [Pseudorhodoferax sp. Leaf267]|uniref:succinylglutamate desuccinylase/aspartoacylase domain-containing protein n=1 Tax=Pseudorhodoferax sp. Leaf267 TaxID=1736316 RepID=UPI0006FEC49A|nr:succinylglutamate desuccinylase/aspartoacylase family protein [Pseudorhodoferax sp. Leaf267]KQP17995.1 succinylglutamate desuccinylase [Pseudorhodoferax sp. Leaf267]
MTSQLRVHAVTALQPGPRLIVLGGVHGDETCGTQGIAQLIEELDTGALVLRRGQLTLVPVANPLARERMQREGERNLNRSFRPSAAPADYEARITNVLCPLLAAHDVLLDLHSFQSAGEAFAMIGPRDNREALEPFQRAREEGQLALHLGTPCVVEGWLDIYAAGIEQRGLPLTDEALAYGWGTNEYMRSQGGYAVTLECGQHGDPAAPVVAHRAIHAALQTLGMVDQAAPLVPKPRLLKLVSAVDRNAPGDRLLREWATFDAVQQGQAIAMREGGSVLVAPGDGYIVFPNAQAALGTEWYYFAVDSDRVL